MTKKKKHFFAVYTPWFKAWVENIRSRPSRLELCPPPERNPDSFREAHASLFDSPIPSAPPGKALEGKKQAEYLASLYPAGEHAAQARLKKILKGQADAYQRDSLAGSRKNTLSVHFASGTLSARQAVRAASDAYSIKALDQESKGIQTYVVTSFSLPPFYTYPTFACWLTAPTPFLNLRIVGYQRLPGETFTSTF